MAKYMISVKRKDLVRALALLAGTGAKATTNESPWVDIEVTSNTLKNDNAAREFLSQQGVDASFYIPF